MQHVKKYKGKHTAPCHNCKCHSFKNKSYKPKSLIDIKKGNPDNLRGKTPFDVSTNFDLPPKLDEINQPKWYKSHPSGIECIEIVRHMNFNRGNAIKYIWRAGKKEDEIYDLAKAIWYLKDEIERVKKEGKKK